MAFNIKEKEHCQVASRTCQGHGAYGWAAPLLSVAGTVLGSLAVVYSIFGWTLSAINFSELTTIVYIIECSYRLQSANVLTLIYL